MSSGSEVRQLVRLPQPSEAENLACPRCNSTNTKFCYYNNYNTSQPRHFCKSCRRYWTRGGALRNVPVGGATRKGSKKRTHSDLPISSPPPVSSANDPIPAYPITMIPAARATLEMVSASASASAAAQSLAWPLNMQGPRLVPYGRLEMELRPVFGETGFGIWAVEEGGQGNGGGGGSVCEASSACNTWQIGGVDSDCFGWPSLQPPK